MKTTQSTINQRQAHHRSLEALYVETTNELCNPLKNEGLKLWRKLHALEVRMTKANEDLCNIPDFQEKADRIKQQVTEAVRSLFGGALPHGFFVNRDPRGYALKLDNEVRSIPSGMYTDWGGYGILAPLID